MPQQRFTRDIYTQILKRRTESERRWTSLLAKDIGDTPLVHVLSDLITSWPPQDLRLDPHYSSTHEVENYADEYLEMLARSMEVRVSQKDLSDNSLICDVYIQSNYDEYDQYNQAAISHNKRWDEQGRPTDAFDPKTGEVSRIKDTYVDLAIPDSKHQPIIDTFFDGVSDGPLSQSRPEMKRKICVRLYYKISLMNDLFTIEYGVKDAKDHVLFWAKYIGRDLSSLVRMIIQQTWGNTKVYGDRGKFLDGIPQLFKGQKLYLCEGVPRPSWLKGSIKSPVSLESVALKTEEAGVNVGHVIFGYVIPFCSIPAIIILIFSCLMEADPYGSGSGTAPWSTFFIGMGVILTVCFLSIKIGGMLLEKSSEVKEAHTFV